MMMKFAIAIVVLSTISPFGLCRPSIDQLPDKDLQGLRVMPGEDGNIEEDATTPIVRGPTQVQVVCMKTPDQQGGIPVVRRMPDDVQATGVWTTYTNALNGESVSTFSIDASAYADLSSKCRSIGFETVQPVDTAHPDFNAFLVDRSLADYYHYVNGTVQKDGLKYSPDSKNVTVTCMKPSASSGGLPSLHRLTDPLTDGEWMAFACKNAGATVFAFAVDSSTYNGLLDECKSLGFETVQPTDQEHQDFNGFKVNDSIMQRYHYAGGVFKKEDTVVAAGC